MAGLFDLRLRALRRDRACRQGPQTFLLERAFDDVLDRLSFVRREFNSVLLIGCPDARWREKLSTVAAAVEIFDPGPLFAEQCGGRCVVEEELKVDLAGYDLCIAIGTLDTVNDLPQALLRIRLALEDNALFVGAVAGGDTLPRLRAAMRAADERVGAASPHVHPRIEPGALAGLLAAAGFTQPVVDVDRVQVAYATLADLVRDLRGMGATNVLAARSRRPLSRDAAAAASTSFAPAPGDGKAVELFEILHFAAWTPAPSVDG